MKKLALIFGIIVMLMVLVTYPATAVETFILGYDFQGESNFGEGGLFIAGESLFNLGKVVTVGYGLEIPLHTLKSPMFYGFIPVFGEVKVLPFGDSFPMDFSLRFGYSYLVGDSNYSDSATLTPGQYYAYGVGYYFDRNKEELSYTKLELFYSSCEGTYQRSGVTDPVHYRRFSILVTWGYEGL